MQRKHNAELTPLARNLRRNKTKQERHLGYDFLRSYPVRFTRQKILGKYIADFYCAQARLVIELDGSQHFEDKMCAENENRTCFLEQYGIQVLRFPNNDVNQNFSGVCAAIDQAVRQSLSQPG